MMAAFPNLFFISIFYLILFPACGQTASNPADKNASEETVNLYINLKKLLDEGIMFGHQDDLAYGINWKYEAGRSDVKEVTGEYPAVFGWDIAGIENDAAVNIDSVPFSAMRQYIKQVYDMGAVNTISWHLDNPLNGKTAWDTTHNSVAAALPGGSKHDVYKSWLDKAAVFFKSLKGSDGKAVPILFRPFHELTGNWFWWGKNTCTPEEYKALWRFTFEYLAKEKKVNNLLYVYNTSSFNSSSEFLERYPGDAYVDVMSFDSYTSGITAMDHFVKEVDESLAILTQTARKHDKIPALAETGFDNIPYERWWTAVLGKALQGHKISYVLLWRNAGWMTREKKYHYYVPNKDHSSAADFLRFFTNGNMIFSEKLRQFNLYKSVR